MGGCKRIFTAIGLLAGVTVAPLFAQTPPTQTANPAAAPTEAQVRPGSAILESFQAYRAALEKGDYKSALEAAERAYRLSKEQNGLGGRTGVLAYNYANLLWEFGDPKLVLPVAQDVAAALEGGAAGLSKPAVQALNGQALLANGDEAGIAQIRASLAAADPNSPADLDFAYRASVALGQWLSLREEWPAALEAWRDAQRFSGGAQIEKHLAEASMLIRQTHALASMKEMRDALVRADEAINLLVPHNLESVGPEPSNVERVLGTAMAWRAGLRSWLRARDRNVVLPDYPELAQAPPIDGVRRCEMKITAPPNIGSYFPQSSLRRGEVAGVVVRIALDAQGQVRNAQVLAIAGPTESRFAERAVSAARATKFERDPSEAGQTCRMNTDSILLPFAFTFF